MKRAQWGIGLMAGWVALLLVSGGCSKSGLAPQTSSGSASAPAAAAIAAPSSAAPAEHEPGLSEHRAGQETVAIAQLPRQAVTTLRQIQDGGPFPFEKDGIVFGNRERLLPPHPRGFYHEYTVPTPRARDRGARRIVCGGPREQIGNCYYSDDHYASFKRIAG